ncbi:MAG: hypothetical protein Ta2B_23150 [Termitinemataceae bacterium]|nr:MAG: hypothetical protein Ta2B_23150 [Termitinemataceae bacterium]
MENANNPKINFQDDTGINGFFVKNRKGIFTCAVIFAILIVGTIVAICVLDAINKKSIKSLEAFIERYQDLTNDFSNEENEDVKKLITELETFGEKTFGYPAARAFLMAGDIEKEQKKWSEAEAAWLKAAKKGEKTHIAPVALYNAGVAAWEQDKASSAIEYYTKAAAYPDFSAAAHAQFAIGLINEEQKDKDAALNTYRELLSKWPNDTTWTDFAQNRILELELNK